MPGGRAAKASPPAPRRGCAIPNQPEAAFEFPYGLTTANGYALCAMRHMHQYGTTSEQLAWIKVAASHHAQHNPNAMLPDVVTVADVVNSPVIADPLHRLDCCVISDGGGALIVAKPEIARSLRRPLVKIIGAGETVKHLAGGTFDLTTSGAARSGPAAFAEAGVKPADIKYASIYDSFTITVLIQIEDLGFCEKGAGGKFVADGNLISGVGKLPFNTDGGGLCNNHPANRGGMTKVIEAVRQLRGEAHPAVQVKNCDARARAGHRHAAWHAALQRDADHGAGVETMADARKIPSPVVTVETQPFWNAARERRFVVPTCTACGKAHWYPRAICPFCGSDKIEWRAASGRGTIYSYSVMRRAKEPYAIAYVTLAEGPP